MAGGLVKDANENTHRGEREPSGRGMQVPGPFFLGARTCPFPAAEEYAAVRAGKRPEICPGTEITVEGTKKASPERRFFVCLGWKYNLLIIS